jgi:hypothetical protein
MSTQEALTHPVHNTALPLPGTYQTLTFQCNVTLYRTQGTLRGVAIVRDPDHNTEVMRRIVPTVVADTAGLGSVLNAVTEGVEAMVYLMHGEASDVLRALADLSSARPAPIAAAPKSRARKKA